MSSAHSFGYSLNTSTIKGQKVPLLQAIRLAADAGYSGIEPWMSEIDEHVAQGGSLKDLAKALSDHGLVVPNVIGFFDWIVDDERRRSRGVEEVKHHLELLAQFGGQRLAVAPMGATDQPYLNLFSAARRYRVLLDLGDKYGPTPMLEFWGMSQVLHTLGEAALVSMESGHPKACILADVYHLFKGGSDPNGFRLLNAGAVGLVHVNDYPAGLTRDEIIDADRVYPGDGVAPLAAIFRNLRDIGYRGFLSLELFNKSYWAQSAAETAKTGLLKLREAVEKALS